MSDLPITLFGRTQQQAITNSSESHEWNSRAAENVRCGKGFYENGINVHPSIHHFCSIAPRLPTRGKILPEAPIKYENFFLDKGRKLYLTYGTYNVHWRKPPQPGPQATANLHACGNFKLQLTPQIDGTHSCSSPRNICCIHFLTERKLICMHLINL